MFCSFVLQSTGMSRTPVVIIYLQTHASLPFPLVHFLGKGAPTKFGFLARGVYLVPPFLFPKRLRHCGTFIGTGAISKDLGAFPAVSLKNQAALAYLARHEHYRHLSLCEHG